MVQLSVLLAVIYLYLERKTVFFLGSFREFVKEVSVSARAQIKVDHRNGQTPDDNQHVKDRSLVRLGVQNERGGAVHKKKSVSCLAGG